MKRFVLAVLALALVVSMVGYSAPEALAKQYKIGVLAPAVTHGWVAAVAYNAEAPCYVSI